MSFAILLNVLTLMSSSEEPPSEVHEHFMNWPRLTGSWGGLRTSLEDSGIYFGGSYVWEGTRVFRGLRERTTSHHLLDGNLALDLESLAGLEGASLYADFYSTHGAYASGDVGDFQGFSNLDLADDVDQLAELWYEQRLGERVRVKVGKVEANSEFAFANTLGYFSQSSAGFSPTLFVLPTYPDPATSVNVFFDASDELSFAAAIYDGALGVDGVSTGRRGPSTFYSNRLSDDYFLILESSFESQTESLSRLWKGGAWYHTGDFVNFDSEKEHGAFGAYALTEWELFTAEHGPSVWGTGQLGWTEPSVSGAEFHLAVGLVVQSPFACRMGDATGLYVTHAHFTDESGAGFDDDETGFEFFYRFQITPAINVNGHLHFIDNPGGDASLRDSWAGSLRVGFAL